MGWWSPEEPNTAGREGTGTAWSEACVTRRRAGGETGSRWREGTRSSSNTRVGCLLRMATGGPCSWPEDGSRRTPFLASGVPGAGQGPQHCQLLTGCAPSPCLLCGSERGWVVEPIFR